jgi:membrane carboxypeptidase/penicillin-binding protein
MKNALSGRASDAFDTPAGIVYATIDKDTGMLATSACPRIFTEAFLTDTQPRQYCDVHGARGVAGAFSKLGGLLKRIIR